MGVRSHSKKYAHQPGNKQTFDAHKHNRTQAHNNNTNNNNQQQHTTTTWLVENRLYLEHAQNNATAKPHPHRHTNTRIIVSTSRIYSGEFGIKVWLTVLQMVCLPVLATPQLRDSYLRRSFAFMNKECFVNSKINRCPSSYRSALYRKVHRFFRAPIIIPIDLWRHGTRSSEK